MLLLKLYFSYANFVNYVNYGNMLTTLCQTLCGCEIIHIDTQKTLYNKLGKL